MKRFLVFAVVIAVLFPAVSSALDLKNQHLRYGPVGALRPNKDVLPGDFINITYDIDNLVLDPKTKKASYVTILELLDAQGGEVYKNVSPVQEVMPQLGGTKIPGNLHLVMGLKQAPGKYSIRLTVHDKHGKDKKAFQYDFMLSPPDFGIIRVSAPAFGLPGQLYPVEMNFINLKLDAKKNPDTEVLIRILDQAGTEVSPAVKFEYPRDLPLEADLEKSNLVPLIYTVYANRTGRFTMEIIAHDKLGKKKAELRYPFTVVDIDNLSGK
jgi:hypothetical protein